MDIKEEIKVKDLLKSWGLDAVTQQTFIGEYKLNEPTPSLNQRWHHFRYNFFLAAL